MKCVKMRIIVSNKKERKAVEQVLFAVCEWEPWKSVHVDNDLREIAEAFLDHTEVIIEEEVNK